MWKGREPGHFGARTSNQLAEFRAATSIELSGEDLNRIEQRVPGSAVAGSRYDAHSMAMLDSEHEERRIL